MKPEEKIIKRKLSPSVGVREQTIGLHVYDALSKTGEGDGQGAVEMSCTQPRGQRMHPLASPLQHGRAGRVRVPGRRTGLG